LWIALEEDTIYSGWCSETAIVSFLRATAATAIAHFITITRLVVFWSVCHSYEVAPREDSEDESSNGVC